MVRLSKNRNRKHITGCVKYLQINGGYEDALDILEAKKREGEPTTSFEEFVIEQNRKRNLNISPFKK